MLRNFASLTLVLLMGFSIGILPAGNGFAQDPGSEGDPFGFGPDPFGGEGDAGAMNGDVHWIFSLFKRISEIGCNMRLDNVLGLILQLC